MLSAHFSYKFKQVFKRIGIREILHIFTFFIAQFTKFYCMMYYVIIY